ncbi:MAG: hypothetical protein ACM3VT_07130 [Solirubrobacterales bacterium]
MTETENDKDLQERTAGRWYILDVSIAVAVLVGGPYFLPIMSYVAGLRNDVGLMFDLGLCTICILWPALAIGLVVVIVRMLRMWPRRIQSRRRLWFLRGVVVGIFVVSFVLPFTPLRLPGLLDYNRGFRRYILKRVDIPVVQAWLSTLNPDVCKRGLIDINQNDKGAVWPAEIAWPSSLTQLDPLYVQFQRIDDGRLAIRLMWYTPWSLWGVQIGPQDMPVPETLPRHKSEMYGQMFWEHGEYRLPIAPGAYVWREIR